MRPETWTIFSTISVLSGGLNLVYGYTGLLSFAQVGFFGIGGYTAALLVVEQDWSLWAGATAGGMLAALVGLVIGYSSLRLSRHAFVIVSLSFALLCMIVALDWVSLTRGAMGIPGLPIPTMNLPGGLHWRLGQPSDFYYLLLSFAVVAHATIYLVVTSRLGRAMRAIKLNEPLAQSQGINPLSYKLLAITLSALLAGMAGGLFVFYLTIIDPSIFDFYYTETMLIMVIIGGPADDRRWTVQKGDPRGWIGGETVRCDGQNSGVRGFDGDQVHGSWTAVGVTWRCCTSC